MIQTLRLVLHYLIAIADRGGCLTPQAGGRPYFKNSKAYITPPTKRAPTMVIHTAKALTDFVSLESLELVSDITPLRLLALLNLVSGSRHCSGRSKTLPNG